MISDARGDQQVIRRATHAALRAWFRQSERLNVARREYKLRGPRFTDFARRIGIIDQTSAYQLVHLHRYRAQIIRRCVDDAADAVKRGQIYRYPGWETALGWFHQTKRAQRRGRYWLTPPVLWRKLDAEFHFDYDPCPNPLPKGFNSLIAEWGQRNYVNPPFSKDDVMGGRGATAFVRKAIEQQREGKLSVIVLPVFDYVTRLLEAGAEIRPLGRVPFLDVDSRRPVPHPSNIACFILRPKP
jgi:DNA N-6-adenine-methyltransferase (Dam)